jgi:hypothetical protein
MKLGLASGEDVSKRVTATLLFLAQSDGNSPKEAGWQAGGGWPVRWDTGARHCGGGARAFG